MAMHHLNGKSSLSPVECGCILNHSRAGIVVWTSNEKPCSATRHCRVESVGSEVSSTRRVLSLGSSVTLSCAVSVTLTKFFVRYGLQARQSRSVFGVVEDRSYTLNRPLEVGIGAGVDYIEVAFSLTLAQWWHCVGRIGHDQLVLLSQFGICGTGSGGNSMYRGSGSQPWSVSTWIWRP